MGGGYPIPVEPQGPSNHGRSSRRHLNLPDSNPLTSNPEVANPFCPAVFRFPISNPPPMANPPPVANPPPLANLPPVTNAEHDDPFGLTDEELNWAYDYTFAQLQFGGLRIEEGYHRSVANTPIYCLNILHLQTPLMWKTPVKHKNYRAGLKGTKLTLGRNTNHPWMKKWFGNLRTTLMMTASTTMMMIRIYYVVYLMFYYGLVTFISM
ncbi:hypothetical protein HanPI659440_Chr17g0696011 [Helianthus annuus]|nr:hypothetical protein HanPI659440_Chr17g0696011 [Helianthus annuus]